MKRKVLSSTICIMLVFCLFSVLSVSVNAALGDVTKRGTMTDTSTPEGGTINWAYTYNRYTGKASLVISGDGYMPNGTDQDWFQVQQNAGCYIYEVTITEGVKSIMSNAFAGEIYLDKINLPSSIERIGENAFAYTAITRFNIPEKVSYVNGAMFAGSPISVFTVDSDNPYFIAVDGDVYSNDMKTLVLGAPGKYINNENYNFQVPESVTEIGPYAFYASPMKNFTIPSNVKDVKKFAFAYCSELSDVVIENGVERLYDNVFLGCDSLKELHLPASVNYIGYCSMGYLYDVAFDALEQALIEAGISYEPLNMDNYEYYSMVAGYGSSAFSYCYPDPNFKIFAPENSAGAKYASNNGLQYVKSQALTPKLLGATNVFGGVQVSWSFSGDATGYYVYRKNLKGYWNLIATVNGNTNTTYLDKTPHNANTNIYTVRAFNSTGMSFYETAGVSVYYLAAPQLKSISNTVDGIRLDWGAQNGIKYYYIYRKAPGQTAWSYLCSVPGNNQFYIDKNVSKNQIYTYTVRAYNGVTTSLWHPQGLSFAFVKNPAFSVANTPTNITVTWTPEAYADYYLVYRKPVNGSWSFLGRVTGNNTSFADTTAVNGTTYRYTVRAAYKGFLSGFYPQGTQIKAIQTPMQLKAYNRLSGVVVSWNKCAGALGYHVYRKVPNGGWLRIGETNSGNALSFVDTKAQNAQDYIYTVIAYSGPYRSSFNSNGVGVKFLSAPKLTAAVSTRYGVSLQYSYVGGSQGYYIYRKIPNGTWTYIGKTTTGTATTYLDKTAKKGQTYIYTVRAYNGANFSWFYDNGIKVKDIY